MSKIQSKLDSLQPYINGIRYVQGMQVVDALFKSGWVVPESDVIKKELVDEATNYYMFYTEKEEVTFDDLLEYVEGIISINIEKEKKNELFKVKVTELRKLFKQSSLSLLTTLKFSINEPTVLTSMDGDISLDDEIEFNEGKENINSESADEVETPKDHTTANDEGNHKPIIITETTVAQGQEIELPPKNKKIELQEFNEPTNVVCKCDDDEACPICEEEKFG